MSPLVIFLSGGFSYMLKIIAVLTITFVAGLAVGIYKNISTPNSSNNNEVTVVGTEYKEENNSDSPVLITQNECNTQIENKLKKQIAILNKVGDNPKEKFSQHELNQQDDIASEIEDPIKILAKYPPPHVTEPSFFGFDVNDEEVLQLREDAINELVYSMEEGGLPEEDIDTAIGAYQHEVEERLSSIEFSHNEQDERVPTIEKQAKDLAQSLWDETVETAENIDQMADDLVRGENEMKVESEPSDPETGLYHPEPVLE